jgi:NAD(P)-dependent dehydrogenase (short-subunit alcohol dehydrogenase family)
MHFNKLQRSALSLPPPGPRATKRSGLGPIRAVWDINAFGVLAVYQAMLPLLRETPGARMVNVSSAIGYVNQRVHWETITSSLP